MQVIEGQLLALGAPLSMTILTNLYIPCSVKVARTT